MSFCSQVHEKISVCLLVLSSLIFLHCSKAGGTLADDSEQEKKTVKVQLVERMDVSEILSYPTDLKPYQDVKIYSQLPDRIISFPWKDGDRIQKGDRVALIRKEGLDKNLESIAAQLEALDVQTGNLEKELQRSQALLQSQAISQAGFDKVNTAYLSALAQKKALQATLGQVTVNANNAIIRAPIDGIIAGKMLETGDMAVPQIPLCHILTVDRLKANIHIIEADVPKVRVGQEVTIVLDAYAEAVKGQVTNILPYLDAGTRTNAVEVTLENPKGLDGSGYLLKPGMYGRGELLVDKRPNVLTVPELSLITDSRLLSKQKDNELLRKAFVIDKNNKAMMKTLKLGIRKGEFYEVLDGISEGDRIVVRGQHGLKEGQLVEVINGKEQS